MFFNFKNLRKINFFFDEIFFCITKKPDLLFRCKQSNFPTYLIPNLEIKHERAKSTINSKNIKNLRSWHYMWSMLFLPKEIHDFFTALNRTFEFLLKIL